MREGSAPRVDSTSVLSSSSQQPALVVVTGIMVAGKSTVAHLLAQRFPRGVHVEAGTQTELDGRAFSLVVLAPSATVVAEQRDAHRQKAQQGRDWAAYLDQELRHTMAGIGLWIDSSHQTPEETVDEIQRRIGL